MILGVDGEREAERGSEAAGEGSCGCTQKFEAGGFGRRGEPGDFLEGFDAI